MTADQTVAMADTARSYRYGRNLVLLSGVVMSLSAPIVRLLDTATAWQFLTYRSAAVCVIVGVMLAVIHRGTLITVLRRGGLRTFMAGVCLAGAFISIVFSLLHTTIANALFLLGTAPFMTAIGAWWFLGERPGRTTLFAIAGALFGMFIMVGEGLAEGDLFGDLTAIGAAVAFAAYSVVIRGGRDAEMVPAVLWGGVISGVVAAACALLTGAGLAISVWDLGVSFSYGAIGIGGGLVLYTMGSKFVPAAELNVLSLGELVLAPLWVWLAFQEVPSGATLIGGAVLLVAILLQAAAMTENAPREIRRDTGLWFAVAALVMGTVLIVLAVARWWASQG